MKVKGPSSPLSSGAEQLEPLDPQQLREAVKGDRFAAALSQMEAQSGAAGAEAATSATRAALEEIAGSANLSNSEGAATAVRESARYMIKSRLSDKFRDTENGERLVADLSEYVASDPLLKNKLLAILRKVQTA